MLDIRKKRLSTYRVEILCRYSYFLHKNINVQNCKKTEKLTEIQ